MKTTGNWSDHEGCNPEWEKDDAYREAWEVSTWGDELFDEKAYHRIDDLVETARWDDETKHRFMLAINCMDEDEMTNLKVAKTLDYLRQYQPNYMGRPYTDITNPTQKQICSFITKLCK